MKHMFILAAAIATPMLAMPAATDASPSTIAPTMLNDWPMGLGIRTPASRRSSKAMIINTASVKGEKGIPCLEAASVIISLNGMTV